MRAVICHAWGAVESLKVEEVPAPVPAADEVLIDVRATSVNYADSIMVAGKYQTRPPFPFSPGLETAGVVAALGHWPPVRILLVTWAALPFAACVHFIVGNWLSLQYPRKFEFGMRRQRPSGLSVLISLGLFFAMNGMLAMSAILSLWFGNLWVLAAVYAGLSLAAITVYRATLESTSSQALRQRDSLLEQLAR